jgi:hypothetical protein
VDGAQFGSRTALWENVDQDSCQVTVAQLDRLQSFQKRLETSRARQSFRIHSGNQDSSNPSQRRDWGLRRQRDDAQAALAKINEAEFSRGPCSVSLINRYCLS